MFASLKNSRTFVSTYITKSGNTALQLSGFFLSENNIGYNTPSWNVNASTALRECRSEGKVVPFFILQPQQIIF